MPQPPTTQHIPLGLAKQHGGPVGADGLPLRASQGLGEPASHPPIRSLYIHTPFCVHKCHYCDFYSFVDNRDQQAAFVDRLIGELRALAPHARGQPLRTIFVGGGTPSLLRLELWERVLAEVNGLFDLSDIRRARAGDEPEFTVECNPESASPELMGLLRAGGVNRVSIGAQSFNPRHLKTLERWHQPENVAKAINAARAAGISRQSVDLIFAIPGQTVAEWGDDLSQAVALGTTHLSCYNLTYEPNTAMTHRLSRGEFEPVDDETETSMFELTVQRLRGAGLERYEVSNFARPGHESRHNIAYWLQEQWLAAGPSASGHALAGPTMRSGSHRWKNVPRLGDYLASGDGFSPITDHEGPDPARLLRERIMMGLRLASGLDAAELLADCHAVSSGSVARLCTHAARVQERGHMTIRGDHARWVLTDSGFMIADAIASDLMRCIA